MWIGDTVWCDGCGIEIKWAPVASHHGQYCCEECAYGLKCDCAAARKNGVKKPRDHSTRPGPVSSLRRQG